jgi:hypothetical protein
MADEDTARKIGQVRSSNPRAAAIDAKLRAAAALAQHEEFFSNEQHQIRVERVKEIVSNFFPVRKGMYVNHRANGSKPFTTVKVDNPDWPHMSRAQVEAVYRQPLRDMEVEVVFSAGTSSYLFRVR